MSRIERVQARVAGAAFACALLSIALGTSSLLFMLALYWMFGSTAVAFVFAGAVRRLLDDPAMYPRSLQAIARAADDTDRPRVVRRTAVALYLYMAGMLFCATVLATLAVAGAFAANA
ncbi:hypothetical protein HK414_01750 [Ramlibacter terrae]|uniref:Uncharacterized protein n=1 Tax=Ramlibacter terrae TaxID=2732511 RepID=A0ABX6P011_9BURK|nr:hypothetical protein HK414_01750 [Ramlibacter terrae]